MPRRLRILAVSQSGGHLVELCELLPRVAGGDADVTWFTPLMPQSRSLLAGQRVHPAPDVSPRDVLTLARTLRPAGRALRAERPDLVVGSGSQSLTALPLAASLGIDAHFVESVTRTDGPSLTGRLLAPVPGVRVYTQDPRWADARWRYGGSVFDGFEPATAPGAERVRSVVVTLGLNPYPFRRLLERLVAILPPDAEVLWQTGETDTAGLPIDAQRSVPARVLEDAMRAADVVVAHAGAGSALQALSAGRIPVLVPRDAARGEQVDDHQPLLAAELARRDLALHAAVDDLTPGLLTRAAALSSRRRTEPPPFLLER